MNDRDAIRHLEQSSNYRVIERLQPPARYHDGAPATPRTGLVIDTETTGLDTTCDKIIELGFVAFTYDAATGLIHDVLHGYDGFEDPGEPLSEIVKQVTGISDEMLAGQKLDNEQVDTWLERADLIIAHNAAFDRRMVERRFPAAAGKHWSCSINEIDWEAEGVSSRKLDYIAYQLGFFFDGHRALNDAQATLHMLSKPLPVSGRPALAALLARAREKSQRIFAVRAPFDKKDVLKARGYQWMPDYPYTDGFGNTKKGVWSTVIVENDIEAEHQWLKEQVYGGKAVYFACKDLTARDRYSVRELQA